MRKRGVAASLMFALWSASAVAIPPALPGDEAQAAEGEKRRQQAIADLASPEADALVEHYFDVTFGERELVLEELFVPGASYLKDGKHQIIAETLDDDGSLGIPQWWNVATARLSDSLAVIAWQRMEPVGAREAVLKFSFKRDVAGELRIALIEEVEL